MINYEFLRWFHETEKKESVITLAKVYYPVFKRILKDVLKLKKNELILIVGDTGTYNHRLSPILSLSYYFAAKKLNLNPKIHLEQINDEVKTKNSDLASILRILPEKTTIVLNLSNKLKKMKSLKVGFRKYCKSKKIRFISTTSLGTLLNTQSYKLIKAYDIDYHHVRNIAISLKKKLDLAKIAYVSTEKGTNLIFRINRKFSFISDGIYENYGEGGNLPGAEVYISPEKDKVDGTLIIDGSSRNRESTVLIKNPIKLIIKHGEVIKIDGGYEAELLKKTIKEAIKEPKGFGARKIGELGIGINPHAEVIGSTIVDEKALGTAHVAIGSNTSFMGTVVAPIHLDQVFYNPKIMLDGKRIYVRE